MKDLITELEPKRNQNQEPYKGKRVLVGNMVINRDVTMTRPRISIPDPTPMISDHH